MDGNMPCRIRRLPRVIGVTGKCRSPIYAEMQAGSFPRPGSIGARSVGWRAADIIAGFVSRPTA
jgi:prophage regulatory protein